MAASAQEGMINGYLPELVMHRGIVNQKLILPNIISLETFCVRDDDIYICTFPKSGTHWTWEIVNMLVTGRAEYAKHWQNWAHLEGRPKEHLDSLPSPRVFFTHLSPCLLPNEIWKRKCHVINVQRNPKDVILSRYMQDISQNWLHGQRDAAFKGTWDQYVDIHIKGSVPNGSILDHMAAWNSFPKDHPDVPFCQIQFEDLKKNPVVEVRRLAEFLGRPLTDETYKQIAEACNFQNLKHASENIKDQTFHNRWREGTSGYFRKGDTGDWKNWFTVAQSERFDRQYLEKFDHAFPY